MKRKRLSHDEWKLEEALERKNITPEQFQLANDTCNKLRAGILSDIISFTEFTMKCREFLKK